MAWIKRQSIIIAGLILYWPAMFIATHIPKIPRWIGPVPFSDKVLHFSAYFLLTFLLWYAISPRKRVSWRKPAVWIILALIAWYGAIDEWLQGYVGRSPDVMDFTANLCGAITAFFILTMIDFWPAVLSVSAAGIFIFTYFFRANSEVMPMMNITILLTIGYGFYNIIWLRFIHYHLPIKCPQVKWWILAFILPIGLLSTIELFCGIMGHELYIISLFTSLGIIVMTTLLGYAYSVLISKRRIKS